MSEHYRTIQIFTQLCRCPDQCGTSSLNLFKDPLVSYAKSTIIGLKPGLLNKVFHSNQLPVDAVAFLEKSLEASLSSLKQCTALSVWDIQQINSKLWRNKISIDKNNIRFLPVDAHAREQLTMLSKEISLSTASKDMGLPMNSLSRLQDGQSRSVSTNNAIKINEYFTKRYKSKVFDLDRIYKLACLELPAVTKKRPNEQRDSSARKKIKIEPRSSNGSQTRNCPLANYSFLALIELIEEAGLKELDDWAKEEIKNGTFFQLVGEVEKDLDRQEKMAVATPSSNNQSDPASSNADEILDLPYIKPDPYSDFYDS